MPPGHTCRLDRPGSKAGPIREGMAAKAAAGPLPALAAPGAAGAGPLGDRSHEPVPPCPERLAPNGASSAPSTPSSPATPTASCATWASTAATSPGSPTRRPSAASRPPPPAAARPSPATPLLVGRRLSDRLPPTAARADGRPWRRRAAGSPKGTCDVGPRNRLRPFAAARHAGRGGWLCRQARAPGAPEDPLPAGAERAAPARRPRPRRPRIARVDFPALAWRHAIGAPPLTRP